MTQTAARPAPDVVRRPTTRALLAPVLVVVALQIAYPLVHGAVRDRLTIAIVLVLAAVCAAHVLLTRGVAVGLAVVLGSAGVGFIAEVIGVHTGEPFGRYHYGSGLGVHLFGVPLVIALAWTMLAWPAAIVARRLASSFGGRVVIGAWALAAADLFLDPQMVAAGQWRWADPRLHLPGVAGVPLHDYAGWLVVSLLLSVGIQAVLRKATEPVPSQDHIVIGVYLWLYAGWVIALAFFLHLPAAAGWGAVAMGLVAVPLVQKIVIGRVVDGR